MPYRITFEGLGTTAVRARAPNEALAIAEAFAERGERNVIVTGPHGERLPLREFAALVDKEHSGKADVG